MADVLDDDRKLEVIVAAGFCRLFRFEIALRRGTRQPRNAGADRIKRVIPGVVDSECTSFLDRYGVRADTNSGESSGVITSLVSINCPQRRTDPAAPILIE